MTAPVLIREIARGELDAETRAAIEECALKIGSRFSVFEGMVTRKIRILFHNARRPSKQAMRAFLAEEFAALPPDQDMGVRQ